uniref:Uncharacterized protein n=1 Tax=Knipowitschia caucasica TaxID=637954 RepID=A0AAV2M1Y6_KNICA
MTTCHSFKGVNIQHYDCLLSPSPPSQTYSPSSPLPPPLSPPLSPSSPPHPLSPSSPPHPLSPSSPPHPLSTSSPPHPPPPPH